MNTLSAESDTNVKSIYLIPSGKPDHMHLVITVSRERAAKLAAGTRIREQRALEGLEMGPQDEEAIVKEAHDYLEREGWIELMVGISPGEIVGLFGQRARPERTWEESARALAADLVASGIVLPYERDPEITT